MFIPVLLIVFGIYLFYQNFGWTANVSLGWGFYWAVVSTLVGLVLLLKKR